MTTKTKKPTTVVMVTATKPCTQTMVIWRLDIPRDRNDEFEPHVIKKHQNTINQDMEGKRDVLGMYVGENESAKFWLSILNGLKNRDVKDILARPSGYLPVAVFNHRNRNSLSIDREINATTQIQLDKINIDCKIKSG